MTSSISAPWSLESGCIFAHFHFSSWTDPADEAVRYEHKVFPHLTDKTIYHGPPDDATDRAWEDLYVQRKYSNILYRPLAICARFTSNGRLAFLDKVSLVSGEQAKHLLGETAPDADVKDRYKITIDIAHQLHCLVRIHIPRSIELCILLKG